MANNNRFTIFDVMDKKGLFEVNPANPGARDQVTGEPLYLGPVEYPKMLYHPEGKTKVIREAEEMETPSGIKMVGEQRELIYEVVSNKAEESKLKAEGWHDHPAKAIAASGSEAPPMSSGQHISSLQAEIARLQAELEKSQLDGGGAKLLPAGVTKQKVA